jgi:hypothetical protein
VDIHSGVGLHSNLHSRAAKDGINALQTNQNIFQVGTFGRLDTVGEDVRQFRSTQSASVEVMHDMIAGIHQSYKSNAGVSKASIDAIDARLNMIQEQLQNSIDQSQSSTNRHRFKNPQNSLIGSISSRAHKFEPASFTPGEVSHLSLPPSPVLHPLRIIKPGLLLQDKKGRLTVELVALDEPQYRLADINQKIALIEHVKGLRLIIWLLQKRNFFPDVELSSKRVAASNFALEASLAWKWKLPDVFSTPRPDLKAYNIYINLETVIPWTRHRPRLQYVFDQIDIARRHGGYPCLLTESLIRCWSRFSVSEKRGQASYLLKLPSAILKRLIKSVPGSGYRALIRCSRADYLPKTEQDAQGILEDGNQFLQPRERVLAAW